MKDETHRATPPSSFILHPSSLRPGLELFNAQRYWDAHEAWEPVWLASRGDEKRFLQALIQFAAAYHHVQRGTIRGAIRLFDAALSKIAASSVHIAGLDCTEVVASARNHRSVIANGGHIGGGTLPKFRYNEDLFADPTESSRHRG
jgi:hypothetical protein